MKPAPLVVIVFAYCLSLYPATLRFTRERGYDAPNYWHAGRGNTGYVVQAPGEIRHPGWLYSDRLLPILRPVAKLPYPAFLAVVHLGNSLGVAAVVAALLRGRRRFPALAWAGAVLVGVKASDFLAGGNIAGLLCGMALTPVGALLACAVKPQFVVALLVHAALCASRRDRGGYRFQGRYIPVDGDVVRHR